MPRMTSGTAATVFHFCASYTKMTSCRCARTARAESSACTVRNPSQRHSLGQTIRVSTSLEEPCPPATFNAPQFLPPRSRSPCSPAPHRRKRPSRAASGSAARKSRDNAAPTKPRCRSVPSAKTVRCSRSTWAGSARCATAHIPHKATRRGRCASSRPKASLRGPAAQARLRSALSRRPGRTESAQRRARALPVTALQRRSRRALRWRCATE